MTWKRMLWSATRECREEFHAATITLLTLQQSDSHQQQHDPRLNLFNLSASHTNSYLYKTYTNLYETHIHHPQSTRQKFFFFFGRTSSVQPHTNTFLHSHLSLVPITKQISENTLSGRNGFPSVFALGEFFGIYTFIIIAGLRLPFVFAPSTNRHKWSCNTSLDGARVYTRIHTLNHHNPKEKKNQLTHTSTNCGGRILQHVSAKIALRIDVLMVCMWCVVRLWWCGGRI